mmetsp:Transcript_9158/g.20540  ORF Transcript_9158/g.20540 Transcript_9158/m.20540 type:complete len:331 (+) Transcript_9158:815-1807(+)
MAQLHLICSSPTICNTSFPPRYVYTPSSSFIYCAACDGPVAPECMGARSLTLTIHGHAPDGARRRGIGPDEAASNEVGSDRIGSGQARTDGLRSDAVGPNASRIARRGQGDDAAWQGRCDRVGDGGSGGDVKCISGNGLPSGSRRRAIHSGGGVGADASVSSSRELKEHASTWRARALLLTGVRGDADGGWDAEQDDSDAFRSSKLSPQTARALPAVHAQTNDKAEDSVQEAGARAAVMQARGRPMLWTACEAVCQSCAAGGNVLIPCSPLGVTLTLIEALAESLAARDERAVPIYLFTPVRFGCDVISGGISAIISLYGMLVRIGISML